MKDLNKSIFIILFKEACEKCFGVPLTTSLSETDSKLLSNAIFEHTGLVLGSKSIKNYSVYALRVKESAKENPSDATLDTLARYVLDAPHTSEIHRKTNESHFPYWFQYRNRFSHTGSSITKHRVNLKNAVLFSMVVVLATATVFIIKSLYVKNRLEVFSDPFSSILDDSLTRRGWIIKSKDTLWWNRRIIKPGYLTLFTLKGDNWKNGSNPAGIKNLLMRRISSECFMTEIHLTNFIPRQNWQQAGILLSEDSAIIGKALRLSISFNDFFGGYNKPAEIIIQVVSSAESGGLSKPEEIAHIPLFSIEPDRESLVVKNLAATTLKIEKNGDQFRFLYTTGSGESFAFKEVAGGKFNINPRYVSLFAIQGWADREDEMPVYFDSFSFAEISCE
jgi:hypothetical protein